MDNKLPLFQMQSILLGWVILEDLKSHPIFKKPILQEFEKQQQKFAAKEPPCFWWSGNFSHPFRNIMNH